METTAPNASKNLLLKALALPWYVGSAGTKLAFHFLKLLRVEDERKTISEKANQEE